VTTAKALLERRDVAFPLGTAFDGLPLVLHVQRGAALTDAMGRVLGELERGNLGPRPMSTAAALQKAIDDFSRWQGLLLVAERPAYLTGRTCEALLGPTVLQRLFGNQETIGTMPVAAGNSPLPGTKLVAALGGGRGGRNPDTARHPDLRLVVPFGANAPHVALPCDACDGERVSLLRPFTCESLQTIAGLRYRFDDHHGGDVGLAMSSIADYQRDLRRHGTPRFRIPRQALGAVLARLGDALGALHARGTVHGDVKPANVLLTPSGVQPIDSLELSNGSVSQAMSPHWAAPEAVLARPSSPASDVWALGMMLLDLLGGTVGGRRVTFVAPVGSRQTSEHTFLEQPRVFLDPEDMPLPTEGLRHWQALLESCLQLDPAQRPPHGSDLARRLDTALLAHPLPGHLELDGGPGVVESVEIDGVVQPAWVLEDPR
jgi:hypothetical protein